MNYAIIAAGEGSRLAQEGVKKPKPLVELNGEPMIGRLINVFTRCNAESISIIVNNEMKEVKAYLDTLNPGVPFNVVVKSTPSSMHSFFELSRVMKPGKFCLTTVDSKQKKGLHGVPFCYGQYSALFICFLCSWLFLSRGLRLGCFLFLLVLVDEVVAEHVDFLIQFRDFLRLVTDGC